MAREDVLVDLAWVDEHREDPTVVLVEVDEDVSAYEVGHIEGAVRLDWTRELQDQLIRDVVDRESFAKLLSEKGIGNDHTVVLYGGNNNWFAAYAYWYFKLYGHRDVRLLDGGRKKWELEARPLTQEVPEVLAASYVAAEQDSSLRAFRDEVVASLGSVNLVDTRSPDEYTGRLMSPAHLPHEQAQRAGHIPTAINVPWSRVANEDGTFKTEEQIRGIYEAAGLDLTRETITYCRIGERSAYSWFVLSELLGLPGVRNYDGSWTEYGSLVGVPVARGSEPGTV